MINIFYDRDLFRRDFGWPQYRFWENALSLSFSGRLLTSAEDDFWDVARSYSLHCGIVGSLTYLKWEGRKSIVEISCLWGLFKIHQKTCWPNLSSIHQSSTSCRSALKQDSQIVYPRFTTWTSQRGQPSRLRKLKFGPAFQSLTPINIYPKIATKKRHN